MYGLPAGLDLSFLQGKSLLQLCIGLHELILNFDEGVSITLTSSIAISSPDRAHRRYEDFREVAGVATRLLNERIDRAKGTDDGTLCLEFSGNLRVEIFDDSRQFESYTIRNRNQLIVV